MSIDLISLKPEPTGATKKIYISGSQKDYPVYRIPLSLLKYNFHNGRISTSISNTNLKSTDSDIDGEIEKIINLENNEIDKTKNNIKVWGQIEPGVVFNNGVVIDGNRRFTCLRKLNKEFPNDERFQYFDAVILEQNEYSEKEIKELEWCIQMGKEGRVNYDPIDKLCDYKMNVIEKDEFTDDDYSRLTNTPINEVKLLHEKADLITDFLEYIKQPNNWYIAKKWKLDGAITEMKFVKKVDDPNKKTELKETIFDLIIANGKDDLGKSIRNEIKPLFEQNDVWDIYTADNKNVHSEILDVIDEAQDNPQLLLDFHNDKKLRDEITKNLSNGMIQVEYRKRVNKPIELMETANAALKNIDLNLIKKLSHIEKHKLRDECDELIVKTREILNIINQTEN